MYNVDKKNVVHIKLKGTQGTYGEEEVIVFLPD